MGGRAACYHAPVLLSDFAYDLPADLIAQAPLPERSASRLLVLDPQAGIQDRVIREFPTFLEPGDLLVFNDTRVIAARVMGNKPTGGRVEIFLERILADGTALVQLRAGKPKEFQITARANVGDFFPRFNGFGPPGGLNAQWIDMPPGPPPGAGAIFEGMELADLSPALGQYFGTRQGVLVIRVPHDGDFLKLQDGDVILSIDGRVPENGSHATRILRSYQPGEKIHLKIMRQKKALELEATLPERPPFGPGDRPPPPG